MALLSLDRHDVLETIRQSGSLHEAFLRVAKLPAVGEYRTATNADRIRAMTDEELAHLLHSAEEHLFTGNLWNYEKWTEWLKQEASDET